jgi:hypothetical protein
MAKRIRDRELQGEDSTMRSSIGLRVTGGLLVVAISFFATMQILDYWLTPPDPSASVIHVVDATYGLACKDLAPPSGKPNLVKVGNFTAALTSACDKAKTTCLFAVDAVQLGDPADGCAKDFIANWRCGNDQKVHQSYLSAEASGRSALLSCPAP